MHPFHLIILLTVLIAVSQLSINDVTTTTVNAAPMMRAMLGLAGTAGRVRMASTVSRALTATDMESIKAGQGILSTAKDTDLNPATPVEHVADNKKPSPFISFTGNSHTSKYYAAGRKDKPKLDTPMGPMTYIEPIVEVRTKKSDIDLRSPEKRAKAFDGGTPEQIAKASGYSKKDSEVLKVGKVSTDEIVRIKHARVEDPAKTERRREFQKNPPVDLEKKATEAAERRAAQAAKQSADKEKNKANAERMQNKVPSSKKPSKRTKGLRHEHKSMASSSSSLRSRGNRRSMKFRY